MGNEQRPRDMARKKLSASVQGEAKVGWRASQKKWLEEYKLEFIIVISIPSELRGEGNQGGDKVLKEAGEYSPGNVLGVMGNGL